MLERADPKSHLKQSGFARRQCNVRLCKGKIYSFMSRNFCALNPQISQMNADFLILIGEICVICG